LSTHTDLELVDLQETLYTSRNPTRRWLHCSRRDWIVEHIQAVSSHLPRALEVGPGAGGYLPTLARVADELVAADIEEAYLDQARTLCESIAGLTCIKDDITATILLIQTRHCVACAKYSCRVGHSFCPRRSDTALWSCVPKLPFYRELSIW